MVFYLQKNFSAVHANDKQFGVGFPGADVTEGQKS